MVKKLLMLSVATLATLLYPSSISAEQQAAERYRQIIEGGKFFIEYHVDIYEEKKSNRRDKLVDKATAKMMFPGKKLAYSGENKKVYINKKSGGIRSLDYVKNPFNASEIFMMNVKYLPLASYQNGKYYQFYGKNEAIVGDENEFTANYINPKEGWDNVEFYLKTPDFFDALYSNDENISSEFMESGKEKIFGKEYQYDKYLVKRNLSNGKIAEESYLLYYDETKNLKYVKENTADTAKITTPNGTVTEMAKPDGLYLLIENFSADIPAGFFDFQKDCKVYRMDLGTLEDLLEMPPLVESY